MSHTVFRTGQGAFPAFALAFSLVAFGCVPYQTFEGVKAERDKLKSAHDALTQQYNRALQEILRLGKEGAGSEVMREKLANLERLNKDLSVRLADLARDRIEPAELPAR